MEGRVLIVEPLRLVREAVVGLLSRYGYRILSVESAAAAILLPHRFECCVFSDTLPDSSALSLAGWFLVEQRIRSAIFFGTTEDVDFRLRASNVGTFVARAEGLHRLLRAVKDSFEDRSQQRMAASAESMSLDARTDSGLRRWHTR